MSRLKSQSVPQSSDGGGHLTVWPRQPVIARRNRPTIWSADRSRWVIDNNCSYTTARTAATRPYHHAFILSHSAPIWQYCSENHGRSAYRSWNSERGKQTHKNKHTYPQTTLRVTSVAIGRIHAMRAMRHEKLVPNCRRAKAPFIMTRRRNATQRKTTRGSRIANSS